MEEEKKDLTVEGNGSMPDHVSRMIGEYTELVYRIDSLEKFLDSHEPNVKGEDGVTIDNTEYQWMVQQSYAMGMYANALEQRLRLSGYKVNVVSELEDLVSESNTSE